jgi:hypothetical protein
MNSFKRVFLSGFLMGVLGVSTQLSAADFDSDAITNLGLTSGDKYRLVFVTNGTRNAGSTDIGVFNAFVTSEGATYSVDGTNITDWLAIASTPSVDARDNTNTLTSVSGVKIIMFTDTSATGAVIVADDYTDLWDGTIDAAINRTQDGVLKSSSVTWTGTNTDGTGYTSLQLGNTPSLTGKTSATNSQWIAGGSTSAGNLRELYAISSETFVLGGGAPIPEPSTYAAMGAMLALAMLCARRRHCRA